MFIYFWQIERQSMSRGGAEREGDTESETGSRLWAVWAWCGAQTHGLQDHDLSQSQMLNQLSHPGAPMFIYFWERQRQNASGLGAESEGDTESKAGSRFWAVSTEPDTGLELTDCEIMTWAEVRHLTNWATQAPYHGLTL